MSDMESDLTQGGPQEPTEEPSGGSDDERSSSIDVSTFEAALQRIESLESQLSGVQSKKDRAVAKTNKRLDHFSERLDSYQRYIEEGLTPAQARRELQIDELLQGTAGDDTRPEEPAGSRGKDADVDAETLETLGLGANDPNVIKMLRDGNTVTDFIRYAGQQRQKQQNRKPQPSTVATTGEGKVTTSQEELRVLKSQYDAEIQDAVGFPRKIFKIKKAYREKGLNVW
jgi:hypothetical protein